MARWATKGSKGTASVQTILGLNAAAASPRRFRLYDYTLGCGATPGDNAFVHIVQRSSAVGTAATPVAMALDLADTLASTIVLKDTHTVDPTLTAATFLGRKALNQRATFRWVASPGGELVCPATASAGINLCLASATTTDMDAEAHFEEL